MDEPDDDICLALATLHGARFESCMVGHSQYWTVYRDGEIQRIWCGDGKVSAARRYCHQYGLFA